MKKLFKRYFPNFEESIKNVIFLLIPIATFFSVMSDRTPYNYFNIVVYGVIAALVVFYVFKYKSFKFDIFVVLILTFDLLILVSQIVNKRISEYPRTILLLSLFSIIIYQFFINVDNKNLVFKLILFGGLIFAAYFVFAYRKEIIKFDFSNRLGEKFSDQNDLSKYLSLFGLTSMLLAFHAKKYWKIPYSLITLLFIGIILLTGSISNVLCFLICSFIIIFVNTKRQNRFLMVLIVASIALLIYLILQLPAMSYFKNRIENIFNVLINGDGNKDGSAADRFALFREALRLFLSRPMFGYGYDQVQYFTHGQGLFSHNNFTELAASFGIVTLIVYEVLLIMPLIKMIKTKKMNQNLSILIVYLFIFQIFLVIFRKKIEFILMPLFFSISCFGYYSYAEVEFKNKKFNFKYVHSTKAIDEKVAETNKKLRVLHLFSADDFSKKYLDKFGQLMSDICVIKNIGIIGEESTCSNNEEIEYVKLDKKIFKYRKLSFVIDKFKPDVVYVDSKLLNTAFRNCIGFSKDTVCYIRDDFDEASIYKSKGIQYVAFNKNTKERFENLSKKKKYHVSLIEDLETKDIANKLYCCTFVGERYLHPKYKDAISYFSKAHEKDETLKFAIMCDEKAYKQLDEHFADNGIDYIDLYVEHSELKSILLSSNSVLLLSSSKVDSMALELYKMSNCKVIYRKPKISSISDEQVWSSFIEDEDDKIIDIIISAKNVSGENKKMNKSQQIEFAAKQYQYEYINLFML